jgi:hypothetical protein
LLLALQLLANGDVCGAPVEGTLAVHASAARSLTTGSLWGATIAVGMANRAVVDAGGQGQHARCWNYYASDQIAETKFCQQEILGARWCSCADVGTLPTDARVIARGVVVRVVTRVPPGGFN